MLDCYRGTSAKGVEYGSANPSVVITILTPLTVVRPDFQLRSVRQSALVLKGSTLFINDVSRLQQRSRSAALI